MRDILVIGASLAGLRTAEALREAGFDGHLSIVGAEGHFPPYDRPPLSKQVLTGEWPLEAARLEVGDNLEAELFLGRRAIAVDLSRREVRLDDGTLLRYDGLAITTGATPLSLLCPGSELDGVYALRTVDDCLQVGAALDKGPRVAVVGAGFIGCEVASSCRARGLDVTLIDVLPLPLLMATGPAVAEVLAARQRLHGVRLVLGNPVAAIRGTHRVEEIQLADGAVIPADLVIMGIGVRPTTDWLEGSGIQLADGVVCDEHCRAVGCESVVAAGDVARCYSPLYGRAMRIEHWTNAVEQSQRAARALLGLTDATSHSVTVPYFWSDQCGARIQVIGITEGQCRLLEGSLTGQRFVCGYSLHGRLVGALCLNWPARLPAYRHMISEGSPFPLTDTDDHVPDPETAAVCAESTTASPLLERSMCADHC